MVESGIFGMYVCNTAILTYLTKSEYLLKLIFVHETSRITYDMSPQGASPSPRGMSPSPQTMSPSPDWDSDSTIESESGGLNH